MQSQPIVTSTGSSTSDSPDAELPMQRIRRRGGGSAPSPTPRSPRLRPACSRPLKRWPSQGSQGQSSMWSAPRASPRSGAPSRPVLPRTPAAIGVWPRCGSTGCSPCGPAPARPAWAARGMSATWSARPRSSASGGGIGAASSIGGAESSSYGACSPDVRIRRLGLDPQRRPRRRLMEAKASLVRPNEHLEPISERSVDPAHPPRGLR
jgi:hypothetical protein